MGFGAQGRSYYQGAIPAMRSAVSPLVVATDRRIVVMGSGATIQQILYWDDISGYWRGQIPFPSIPPETGEGIVLFLHDPARHAPFPRADLVIDPRGDADAWEVALRDQGKARR